MFIPLKPKPTQLKEKTGAQHSEALGDWGALLGYSQAALSCSMNVPSAQVGQCRNVYSYLICFPFCDCRLPKARNHWNKPRQGPGEQTGLGPGQRMKGNVHTTGTITMHLYKQNKTWLLLPPRGPTTSRLLFTALPNLPSQPRWDLQWR